MTDTPPIQAPQDSLRRYCTACGSPSEVSARYCGRCGLALDQERPTPETATSAASSDDGQPSKDSGRRAWAILAVIGLAVTLVGAGAAAAVLANQPGPEDAALGEALESAEVLLADVQDAQVTADLRTVADAADSASEPVTDVLAGLDPASDTAQALAGLDEVFTALAGLGGIDADTLNVWAEVRADLDTALDELPTQVDGVLPLTNVGADAIAAADTLIADAEQTLANWEASVDAAERATQENAAAVLELDTYEDAVLGQLRTYNSLRNDTSDFVALVESPDSYVTWSQAYDAMSTGAMARREVRDALNAMAVPDGIQAEHTRLVSMVEDAAAAMDAGYSGLSEADACWYDDCYYADTPGWQTFRQESARITGEFAAADTAWQTGMASLRADASPVTAARKMSSSLRHG